MLKQLLVLITLFLFFAQLYSQDPLRYTTKQGLPTNHIYDVVEDAKGCMWFATKQGVVKFDGESFKTFTVQDGLPINDTWGLHKDFEDKIWYYSKSFYQGYIKNDSIYKFANKDEVVLTPRVTYNTNQNFWFFYDGVKSIEGNEVVDYGLNIIELNQFLEGLNAQHKGKGLQKIGYFLNPENKEIVIFNLKAKELSVYNWDFIFKYAIPLNEEEAILSSNMHVSNTGMLYNQTGYILFDAGILFVNFKDKTSRFIPNKCLYGVDKISDFRCKGLQDEIQLSISGQLVVLDYQFNKKEHYSYPEHLGKYSYKDSRNNIWLIDLSKGISLLRNTQLHSKVYFKNKKVQKILEIDGEIYVGVSSDGFYKIDDNLKDPEVLLTQPLKVLENHSHIYQIKENKLNQERLFIANNRTYSLIDGHLKLFRFNLLDYNLNENIFFGGKDLLNFNNAYYLLTTRTIHQINKDNHQSTLVSNISGLLCGEVYANHLYFAGSGGLYVLDQNKLKRPILPNKLIKTGIRTLCSSGKYLYVGTDGRGVYLYHPKGIVQIKTTDGLSIKRIIIENDVLWLATQSGVKKVKLNFLDIEHSAIVDAFYESDGILQNNVNDICRKDNFLYVASDLGLSKIDIHNPFFKKQPQLYFKTKKDTLHIKSTNASAINVQFGLLDFVNQSNIKFAYRLLPSQEDWIETRIKSLNFTNLSPDIYALEVKATDQHNNESIAKLYLDIIPLWYQTTPARVVFIIALIGLLYLIFYWVNRIFRNNEERKFLQKRQVSSLELQALRSQMNPHFVHNSLNAIQYFIQRNEVELSENYLAKFSKLIRLFFEYSRRKTVTVEEEIELLSHYLAIEKLRFEDKLNYKIVVSKEMDTHEQMIPSMILQPIVENAVNHGLFHKKDKGLVEIHFNYISPMAFAVTVKDDGIGIIKGKLLYKKSSSQNNQSNSSKVLIERLDLLNKGGDWKISYNIKDLSELDKNKTGTIIHLVIHQKTKE